MKPLTQIFINDRSGVHYIDLVFDAVDNIIIHRENIPRKIEEIGG